MKKILAITVIPLIVLSLNHPAAGQSDSSSMDVELIRAARSGDAAAVQQLLQKGASIEAVDSHGDTPLIAAAERGQSEVVKLLLEKGANIDTSNLGGSTALMHAAAGGFTGTVQTLMDRKPDIVDLAMILAARRGQAEVVRLMLNEGVDVNARDLEGSTALIAASHRDPIDGRRHREPCPASTALITFNRGGQTRVVNLPLAKDTDTEITFHRSDQLQVVKLLLEMGANTELRASNGFTALRSAVEDGDTQVIEALADKGADLEDRDKNDHVTALLRATIIGKMEVVKVLLEKGAKIEATDVAGGGTALVLAANEPVDLRNPAPYSEIVKVLLDHGANTEARGSVGRTALICAVYRNRPETVKSLLDHGAHLDAKDNFGKTAFDIAMDYGYFEIVHLLQDRAAQ